MEIRRNGQVCFSKLLTASFYLVSLHKIDFLCLLWTQFFANWPARSRRPWWICQWLFDWLWLTFLPLSQQIFRSVPNLRHPCRLSPMVEDFTGFDLILRVCYTLQMSCAYFHKNFSRIFLPESLRFFRELLPLTFKFLCKLIASIYMSFFVKGIFTLI